MEFTPLQIGRLRVTRFVLDMDSVNANTGPNVRTCMTEPDELAARLVALDGYHMKLKGEDRLVAIRMMAQRRIPSKEMALRLKITVDHLRRLAKSAKIEIPKEVEPVHWSYNYIFARETKTRKREKENAKRRTRSSPGRNRQSPN